MLFLFLPLIPLLREKWSPQNKYKILTPAVALFMKSEIQDKPDHDRPKQYLCHFGSVFVADFKVKIGGFFSGVKKKQTSKNFCVFDKVFDQRYQLLEKRFPLLNEADGNNTSTNNVSRIKLFNYEYEF